MSIYKGQFKNINEELYTITIDAHLYGTSDETEIVLGENPCTISSDSSDGIFSPIKSRSCTIEILTKEWLFDLYSPTAKGIPVRVQKGLNTVFFGYLTPNSYNQSYTYIDNISLEAVDAVSVLKNFPYTTVGSIPTYQKVIDIIVRLLDNAGYSGMLYVPYSYTGINGSSSSNVFSELTVSEGNFFDDDDDRTPWTQYEVLEELMKFLGFSLCPVGDDVYLVDYRVAGSTTSPVFHKYEICSGEVSTDTTLSDSIIVNKEKYASGEPELSMDDVYNKIEISDNLYEVEDIAPEIDDENNHISINEEQGFSVSGSRWVKTTIKKHWLRSDESTTEVKGTSYATICRLNPDSNWTHHFYKMDTLCDNPEEVINADGMNYYDSSLNSEYTNKKINQYVNTHCCLFQHFAYLPNKGNILPTSLDWEGLLTFFVTNDKLNGDGKLTYSELEGLELPVLEYEVPEEIMFKPSTGKSWITINGSLFYQFNDARYGEKESNTLNIVNTSSKVYTTNPVDKCCDIEEQSVDLFSRTYSNGTTRHNIWDLFASSYNYTGDLGDYGDGFKMWKMKVQIGDKYWNGSSWTTTESDFYLSFNNNPDGSEKEYMPFFGWATIVPNTDYTDNVGENCYCIPIDANDSNAPTSGQLKVTVYTPLFFPREIMDLIDFIRDSGGSYDENDINWYDIPPVIFCKDFEIGYIYTDTNKWYSQKKSNESGSDDILYTNVINENYTNNFDGLELRINTQQADKPISRSYITTTTGYLSTLKHRKGTTYKEQEKNLIDLYYNHYSSPKRIYECNVHGGYILPYTKFTTTSIGGRYILDSQSYDLKQDNNTIKLIEF